MRDSIKVDVLDPKKVKPRDGDIVYVCTTANEAVIARFSTPNIWSDLTDISLDGSFSILKEKQIAFWHYPVDLADIFGRSEVPE